MRSVKSSVFKYKIRLTQSWEWLDHASWKLFQARWSGSQATVVREELELKKQTENCPALSKVNFSQACREVGF